MALRAEAAVENLRFAAARDYDDALCLALTKGAVEHLRFAEATVVNARRPFLPGG